MAEGTKTLFRTTFFTLNFTINTEHLTKLQDEKVLLFGIQNFYELNKIRVKDAVPERVKF